MTQFFQKLFLFIIFTMSSTLQPATLGIKGTTAFEQKESYYADKRKSAALSGWMTMMGGYGTPKLKQKKDAWFMALQRLPMDLDADLSQLTSDLVKALSRSDVHGKINKATEELIQSYGLMSIEETLKTLIANLKISYQKRAGVIPDSRRAPAPAPRPIKDTPKAETPLLTAAVVSKPGFDEKQEQALEDFGATIMRIGSPNLQTAATEWIATLKQLKLQNIQLWDVTAQLAKLTEKFVALLLNSSLRATSASDSRDIGIAIANLNMAHDCLSIELTLTKIRKIASKIHIELYGLPPVAPRPASAPPTSGRALVEEATAPTVFIELMIAIDNKGSLDLKLTKGAFYDALLHPTTTPDFLESLSAHLIAKLNSDPIDESIRRAVERLMSHYDVTTLSAAFKLANAAFMNYFKKQTSPSTPIPPTPSSAQLPSTRVMIHARRQLKPHAMSTPSPEAVSGEALVIEHVVDEKKSGAKADAADEPTLFREWLLLDAGNKTDPLNNAKTVWVASVARKIPGEEKDEAAQAKRAATLIDELTKLSKKTKPDLSKFESKMSNLTDKLMMHYGTRNFKQLLAKLTSLLLENIQLHELKPDAKDSLSASKKKRLKAKAKTKTAPRSAPPPAHGSVDNDDDRVNIFEETKVADVSSTQSVPDAHESVDTSPVKETASQRKRRKEKERKARTSSSELTASPSPVSMLGSGAGFISLTPFVPPTDRPGSAISDISRTDTPFSPIDNSPSPSPMPWRSASPQSPTSGRSSITMSWERSGSPVFDCCAIASGSPCPSPTFGRRSPTIFRPKAEPPKESPKIVLAHPIAIKQAPPGAQPPLLTRALSVTSATGIGSLSLSDDQPKTEVKAEESENEHSENDDNCVTIDNVGSDDNEFKDSDEKTASGMANITGMQRYKAYQPGSTLYAHSVTNRIYQLIQTLDEKEQEPARETYGYQYLLRALSRKNQQIYLGDDFVRIDGWAIKKDKTKASKFTYVIYQPKSTWDKPTTWLSHYAEHICYYQRRDENHMFDFGIEATLLQSPCLQIDYVHTSPPITPGVRGIAREYTYFAFLGAVLDHETQRVTQGIFEYVCDRTDPKKLLCTHRMFRRASSCTPEYFQDYGMDREVATAIQDEMARWEEQRGMPDLTE